MQPCYRAARTLNVTLKLPDELCRKARHSAVDESKSLSAWVAGLIEQALEKPEPEVRPQTLAEAMMVPGMPDSFYEKDFHLPDRREVNHREFSFESDED